MKIYFYPNEKQLRAWRLWHDKTTREILYGGAGGGGKSYLICYLLIEGCLKYPGTRWLLGRYRLKTLKETTLKTMFEVLGSGEHGVFHMKAGEHFIYRPQEGVIIFPRYERSEIVLKQLAYNPSDPDFDELGSTEYTGAGIDELPQIREKATSVIKSRIRYRLDEYNLISKIIYGTNPTKSWVYNKFYKPWREGRLPKHMAFVQAFIQDNPKLPKDYLETLNLLDAVTRERILKGNWEYSEDPAKLCDYDAICDVFTNFNVPEGIRYVSTDLAMQGRDKFVIITWSGLRAKIHTIKSGLPAATAAKIIIDDVTAAMKQNQTPSSRTVADSDGLGQYLQSFITNIRAFHGGSSAVNSMYANLRSECMYKLAEMVNKRQIFIDCEDISLRNQIIQELEQLRRDRIDNDESRLRIIKKDAMRENIGRSPDILDTLMMRMIFELHATTWAGKMSAI